MSDTNDNFEDLKRLLKLKRHEIPPPGYFNQFSSGVLSRIRDGETGGGRSVLDWFFAESPLASFFQVITLKSGVVGTLATTACLAMIVGVLVMDRDSGSSPVQANMTEPPAVQDRTLASVASLAPPDEGITVSTNPVASLLPVNSIFNSPQNPLFQSAGYMPANP